MSDANSSNDRLDRLERIVEATALATSANARAIEGLRLAQEADRVQLRDSIAEVVSMLTQWVEQSGEERAQLQQRQSETDNRFNVLLEEARADRAEMRQAIEALRRNSEDRPHE